MHLPEAFVLCRDPQHPQWSEAVEAVHAELQRLQSGTLGNVPRGDGEEIDDAVNDAIINLIGREPREAFKLLDHALADPTRIPDAAALQALCMNGVRMGVLPDELAERLSTPLEDHGIDRGTLDAWARQVFDGPVTSQRAYLRTTLKNERISHLRDQGWKQVEEPIIDPETGNAKKRWSNLIEVMDEPLRPMQDTNAPDPDAVADARIQLLDDVAAARTLLFEDVVSAAAEAIRRAGDRAAFRESVDLLRRVVAGEVDLGAWAQAELGPRPDDPTAQKAWAKDRRRVLERFYTRFKRARMRILDVLQQRTETARTGMDEATLARLATVEAVFHFDLCIRDGRS